MKKLLLCLLATLPAFGAGSVGQSINPLGPGTPNSGLPDTRIYVMAISWVGDSVNGTVPATSINISAVPQIQGYRLFQMEIQPGTPSPSSNYSMTLVDGSGVDLLQGQGASLSAINAFYAGSITSPPVLNSPTFNLSGNSVASARGTVTLYFAPVPQAPINTGLAGLTGNNTFTGSNTFNGGAIIPPSLTTPFGPGEVIALSCSTFQRTESAADNNLLTCAIPAVAGSYRVRFSLDVSAANAATLGFQVCYIDSSGNNPCSNVALFQYGTATPALTFTTSVAGNYYGYVDISVNASGSAPVVKLTFSGTSFTGKASATVERII